MSEELNAKIEKLTKALERQQKTIADLQSARTEAAAVRAEPRQATSVEFDKFKVPDLIRSVPKYDGDEKYLSTWLDSVEQKLNFCKQNIPQGEVDVILPLWTGLIRDQITGKADAALASAQTPIEWEKIKSTLKERFGDKRDFSTLLSSIQYLTQGTLDVTNYYYKCQELLAAINSKVSLNDEMKACQKVIMANYELMITNAFIDGLHEPFAALTRTSNPQNLLQAYQSASDQINAAKRRREKIYKPQNQSSFPRPFQQQYFSTRPFQQQLLPSRPLQHQYTPNRQFQHKSPSPRPGQNYFHQNMQSPPRTNNQYRQNIPNRQFPAIKAEPISTTNLRPINYHENYEESSNQLTECIDNHNEEEETTTEVIQEEENPEYADNLNFHFLTEPENPE